MSLQRLDKSGYFEVPLIQNPKVDADLYAMFSAVAAPTAYFAAQL